MLLTGVAGAAGATGLADYKEDHPSPTARVSPLPEASHGPLVGKVVWRGEATGQSVALTFDDGPDPRWTGKVLDILSRHNASGTFFMLEDHVRKSSSLARRVVVEGHEIGIHGANHVSMPLLSAERLRAQIVSTRDTIQHATGVRPRLLRPPYGQFDAPVLYVATELGLPIILWSHRLPGSDSARLADSDVQTASPGMIILSHDSRGEPNEGLIAALDGLIPRLQARGLELVTVSQMLSPELG